MLWFGLLFLWSATAWCQDNPDEFLNTPQLIKRYGFQAESHIVETSDGYLLTVHRIAASRNGTKGGQPIFLQHGLFSSSADWVDVGNNSLGFVLADNGYDVWIGNARGNRYSRAHVSLSPSSSAFWNFSWHEMGTRDLPAVIDYISNYTNKPGELIYVGHSMGTTMFFVFSSLLQETASKIKSMVALAPVAYMSHIRSPIKYLTPFESDIEFLIKHLGINQFLPSDKILSLLEYDCLGTFAHHICDNIIFALFGFDKDQIDEKLLPVIASHAPAGTSTKTVLHYLQVIASKGKFQHYDYGRKENLIRYNQTNPPLYNLQNIKVPMHFIYADNDMLASPLDVIDVYKNISSGVNLYEIPLKTFDHLDFVFARDAKKLVYEPLLKFIRKDKESDSDNSRIKTVPLQPIMFPWH